jgi:hypothetical protein
MAAGPQCPSCGETEALRGTPFEDDIAVTCQTCGATWMRGAPKCKTCGGEDIVPRPQAMSRNPRGNQLAFVGWREIPLCRRCDADALSTSLSKNQPVPEGYVSASLFDSKERVGASTGSRQTTARRRRPDVDTKLRQRPPSRPASARATPTSQDHGSTTRPKAAPTASEPPTVRQAVEAFLASDFRDADATAMLMLATQLAPSSRLSALEGPEAATALAAWFQRLYGPKEGKSRNSALRTVVGAIDFWRAQGWVADDPAAGFR